MLTKPVVIDGLTLHPEMAQLLALGALRPRLPLSEQTPADIRAAALRDATFAAGAPTPVYDVTDLTVDGATGPVRARLYAPAGHWSALLVFFHGGGFVHGDVDTHDATCRLLCAAGGFAVLSVEYRLAPEHPHPAATDDAWAAWQWVLAHAATLPGAELPDVPARVGVGGDSAGGLLAAAVCQLAERSGRPAPAAQILIYPAISRAPEWPSMTLFGDGFFLTRADIEFFEASLLGGRPDDPADIRRHPLTGQLAGLPPALVVTGGFDPLRDGGEAYAAALTAAGTPAELIRYDGLIHGFVNMIGFSAASRAATVDIAEATATLLS